MKNNRKILFVIAGIVVVIGVLLALSLGENAPLKKLFSPPPGAQVSSQPSSSSASGAGASSAATPLEPVAKEFSKTGFAITLTDAFFEQESITHTAIYQSEACVVTVVKEDFAVFESSGDSDITLREYTDLIVANNDLACEVVEENGLVTFTYTKPIEGNDTTFYVCVFSGADAYWLVHFICDAQRFDALKPQLMEWAATVKV